MTQYTNSFDKCRCLLHWRIVKYALTSDLDMKAMGPFLWISVAQTPASEALYSTTSGSDSITTLRPIHHRHHIAYQSSPHQAWREPCGIYSSVASPKFGGEEKKLWRAKCLILGKNRYFVWDTNFQSTNWLLLCTEDDNSCYRNVCKMSVVSFALAVVFIIRLFSTSAFRVPKLTIHSENMGEGYAPLATPMGA